MAKYLLVGVLLLAVLFSLTIAGARAYEPTAELMEALVIEVIDGDTIRVKLGWMEEEVRYIGIDAPDFNFGLEKALKRANIKTVHYVSPSIWAWREYRVKKIAHSTDLMLTLFPFEEDFYKKHNIQVSFVGHPSADTIPLVPDTKSARRLLNLPVEGEVVAILPGSRVKELHYMVDDFILGANLLYQKRPSVRFVAPMANKKIRNLFEQAIARHKVELPITIIDGNSHSVMEAADIILLASGTAALEAMLLKKPMVACYRVSAITAMIVRLFNLIKVKNFRNAKKQRKTKTAAIRLAKGISKKVLAKTGKFS